MNLTLDADQAVLWRAVLEAIGYDYMDIARLYASAGVDMSRLTITEGGSRDDLWNQMKADMLNATAITLKNAGSAIMTDCLFGAYAVGAVDDIVAALTASLDINRTYVPDASNHAFYDKQYALRTKLIMQDMADAFATIREMTPER